MSKTIKEYRIPLPISTKEYQVGQLYSVAEASKDNTGGGEGVEVVKNEPYEDENSKGQYTYKIFRMESKVPPMIRKLMPKGSMTFHEHAWNAYPYCKTVISNPGYMKDNFECKIETWHKDNDLGDQENIHNLSAKDWKSTDVVRIDIVNDNVKKGDYKADSDTKLVKSSKRDCLPMKASWMQEIKMAKNSREQGEKLGMADEDLPKVPTHMTAYKLVTIKFKWMGFQAAVEKMGHSQQKKIFTLFHRQLICWLDNWVDLTMEDIRRLEDQTKKDLEANINKGEKRGVKLGED